MGKIFARAACFDLITLERIQTYNERETFPLRGLLRPLEVVVRLLALHLLLLGGRQVALEGLLHLLQDSEDGARPPRTAVQEKSVRSCTEQYFSTRHAYLTCQSPHLKK